MGKSSARFGPANGNILYCHHHHYIQQGRVRKHVAIVWPAKDTNTYNIIYHNMKCMRFDTDPRTISVYRVWHALQTLTWNWHRVMGVLIRIILKIDFYTNLLVFLGPKIQDTNKMYRQIYCRLSIIKTLSCTNS